MSIAVAPTTYTTPSGAVGSMDKAVAEFWVKTALETRAPNLVMDEIVNRGGSECWKRVPAKMGSLVHWWRLPLPDAKTTALVETAGDLTGENVSAAEVTAQVAQYGNYIQATDIMDSIMLQDPRRAFGKYLMYQCLRTNDALIKAEAYSGGTELFKDQGTTATAVSTISASSILTRAYLAKLALYFKNNYVPPCENGWYLYLAHPQTIKDLRADTSNAGWLDVTKYDMSNEERTEIKQAFVGRCEAFEILETPEISTSAGGAASANVYKNIASGYQAMGGVSLSGRYTPGAPQQGTGSPKGMPQRQEDMTPNLRGQACASPLCRV
ncbi:MAG: N4-gp56 family major capsid protein [Candidatus Hodarchaeales archaeon]